MPTSTQPSTTQLLARLRALAGEPSTWWDAFSAADWPTLFVLLDIAAGLPQLGSHPALRDLGPKLWPELTAVTGDLERLQRLVEHPVVPRAAIEMACHTRPNLEEARAELAEDHCTAYADFLDAAGRSQLEAAITSLPAERAGSWGGVEKAEAPALFAVVEQILGGEAFRTLTGFDLGRDSFSVTLSLQDLQAAGIAWHRDLYWPKEWVGRDVFALFYALGEESPEKGGAFVYYLPWRNEIRAVHRRRHQATVLWNGRTHEERILHAVAGYRGSATDRHLLILQCLRRA